MTKPSSMEVVAFDKSLGFMRVRECFVARAAAGVIASGKAFLANSTKVSSDPLRREHEPTRP